MSVESLSDLHNHDWAEQLAADASHFQQLLQRLDTIVFRAGHALHRKDYVAAAHNVIELREGIHLLAKLAEVKIHVTEA